MQLAFATCLARATASGTRLAPTSLKTIINRFLHARCSLRVRIFPCISNKTKQTHKSVSALFGGEGEIRTPAPLSRPTPLAGAPLRPLEYFSRAKCFTLDSVVRLGWERNWRRGWDSNPRPLSESLVFKTSSLNHSDTSPRK